MGTDNISIYVLIIVGFLIYRLIKMGESRAETVAQLASKNMPIPSIAEMEAANQEHYKNHGIF